MTFYAEPPRKSLAEIIKAREFATALPTQFQDLPKPTMSVLPQATIQPRQIGGIGSMLPMQTITLPGGQTVQMPEINMEEVNANLLAAGITPQVPLPAITPPVATPTTPTQAEAIMQYLGEQGDLQEGMDVDGDGQVTLLDAVQSLQIDQGLRNADGTAIPQAPTTPTPAVATPAVENVNPFGDFDGVINTTFGPMKPMTPEEKAASDAAFRELMEKQDDKFFEDYYNLGRGPTSIDLPGGGRQIAAQEPFDFGGLTPKQYYMQDKYGVDPMSSTAPVDTVGAGFDPTQGGTITPPAPVTPPPAPREDMPFVPSVRQVATGLDPLTEQLLFGIGGEGGFIPGAMRAAERTFFNPDGTPRVIEEQVAGFSPDQLRAQELARQGVGIQDRFISGAEGAFGRGLEALQGGFGRTRDLARQGLEATRGGVGALQRGLGESADILRGTIGGYDQGMTNRFYNPFEDRVVQQTIDDIMEAGAKQDIAARAGDIGRGGESAFGSRARLGASERQEALGRGLAEALGGIRARGFSEAQQTGLGEFARQRAAERAAASGLAGLTGQGFGGQQALAGALTGLGGIESQLAQRQQAAQFGLGSALQGLGAQAQGASATDVAQLYGMGTQQQALTQAQLDAQRRNQMQAQQAPLAQFQALAPFVSMAPAGQFQTVTDFAPPPSPLQAGLGVGLSTFGALGNLYGGQG